MVYTEDSMGHHGEEGVKRSVTPCNPPGRSVTLCTPISGDLKKKNVSSQIHPIGWT
jgi:hypothetical protein